MNDDMPDGKITLEFLRALKENLFPTSVRGNVLQAVGKIINSENAPAQIAVLPSDPDRYESEEALALAMWLKQQISPEGELKT